jgi:Protein of unknown function (DUF2889)
MSLPPAAPQRQLKHRRQIDVQVFARGNGLWEVDARLTDTKTRDLQLAEDIRPAGTPIHDMLLRLVVNEQFDVLEAGSHTEWMPYQGVCDRHGAESGDAYDQLVGMNLMRGFHKQLRDTLGGSRACTHITELAQVLPTAVMQAFAGLVVDTRGDSPGASRPFQLDRCHALRSDGEAVRRHYPRWYRAPAASAATATPDRDPS